VTVVTNFSIIGPSRARMGVIRKLRHIRHMRHGAGRGIREVSRHLLVTDGPRKFCSQAKWKEKSGPQKSMG